MRKDKPDYDSFPVGTVVRRAQPDDSVHAWRGVTDATAAGVVEDGNHWTGTLDVRWIGWQADTRPEAPEDLLVATPEWLGANGYAVVRAI